MENKDIRLLAAGHGIRLWQIADKIGITDSSFSRLLRKPLSEEKRAAVFAAIEELTAQQPPPTGAKEKRP